MRYIWKKTISKYFRKKKRMPKKTDSFERPWCWERLKAGGGEGDNRGWDGWVASPTQWMWVWVNSRSWWWTGRPGVLQSMESQKVGHDWVTELNWRRLLLKGLIFKRRKTVKRPSLTQATKNRTIAWGVGKVSRWPRSRVSHQVTVSSFSPATKLNSNFLFTKEASC